MGLVMGAVMLRAHGLPQLVLSIAIVQLLHEAANKASWLTGGSDGLSGMMPAPLFGLFEFDLWGRSAYLTRAFWPLLGERLGDRVLLRVAEREGEPVAAALNLIGRDAIYGRNWGTIVDVPFLHFELCYYMAMDFAIAHGIARVEAGAQGEHKIQRGYLPVPTYSAHWIAHPGLSRAVAEFLARERPAMEREMAALATLSPFRQADDTG
jgi:predicted N-acyltransferase